MTKLNGEVIDEGRHAILATPGKRLLASLREDKVNGANWSEDTLGRYLQVGKRIEPQQLQALFMLWEATEQRNALIDNITVLRAITSTATTDADFAYVVEVLYYEQRARLRTDIKSIKQKGTTHNDSRTPTNIMKAILMRRCLFVHIKGIFPALKDTVESMCASFGQPLAIIIPHKIGLIWSTCDSF